MEHPHDTCDDSGPSKKAANVSLSKKMLKEAKGLKVNVSAACEAGLTEEVRKARWKKWQEDNREAIAAYNRRIEKQGLLSRYFHDYGSV